MQESSAQGCASTVEPTILIYSRSSAQDFRDWLADHGTPGRIQVAASPEEAAQHVATTEILLSWRFPADLFPQAHNLSWVQSIGAGVEDLVGASVPPDVLITRIVGQFGSYIGEYVFAELLYRVRELGRSQAGQRERRWDHFEAGTLSGKVIGIAGLGSIGGDLVRKARAFDMHIYGLSRTPKHANLVDRHFGPNDWQGFVRDLDVLVLTLPRTPQTEGVVGREVLAAMKPDAVLVNVGRGAVIDESAMIAALQNGQIGGAILDVFQQEPLPAESPLWTLSNVTVTPHISGPSTIEGVGQFFLDNLQRFLRGEPLEGVVDRARGY